MTIRTVAMVVGVIGGFYGLIAGFFGGIFTALAISNSSGLAGILYLLLAVAAPILGLVGAGMVTKKPLFGSSLMAVGGVGMLLVHLFGIVPALFFLAGALLGVIGKYQS